MTINVRENTNFIILHPIFAVGAVPPCRPAPQFTCRSDFYVPGSPMISQKIRYKCPVFVQATRCLGGGIPLKMIGEGNLLICFVPFSLPSGLPRGLGAEAGVPIAAVIFVNDF